MTSKKNIHAWKRVLLTVKIDDHKEIRKRLKNDSSREGILRDKDGNYIKERKFVYYLK